MTQTPSWSLHHRRALPSLLASLLVLTAAFAPSIGQPSSAPDPGGINTAPMNRLVILGERNSGIHWIGTLFELNSPELVRIEPMWPHAEIQGPELDFREANSTLFVHVVKDPYAWVVSMRERAPSYLKGKLTTLVQYADRYAGHHPRKRVAPTDYDNPGELQRFAKTPWRASLEWNGRSIQEHYEVCIPTPCPQFIVALTGGKTCPWCGAPPALLYRRDAAVPLHRVWSRCAPRRCKLCERLSKRGRGCVASLSLMKTC